MYAEGTEVPKDEAKAYVYYKKAADLGNSNGVRMLGVCYEYGMGVAIDKTAALKYYKQAADQGNQKAQKNYDDLNSGWGK